MNHKFKEGDEVYYDSRGYMSARRYGVVCSQSVHDAQNTRCGGDSDDPRVWCIWPTSGLGFMPESCCTLHKAFSPPPPAPDLTASKLDLTKPVQTKGGAAVRILCTDRPGSRCVVWMFEKCGTVNYVGIDGKAYGNDALDLVNVPPPPPKPASATTTVKYYLIRNKETGRVWVSRRKNRKHGDPLGTKTLDITITEGEGMCSCEGVTPCKCGDTRTFHHPV